MIIGGFGIRCAYKLHHYVERRFKIDDAVGAVAVHGYAGFIGVVIAGFVLWGAPSSPYEGYATINPLVQLIGAVIIFGLLDFLPAWIVSKFLNKISMLRIPREVELMGLDFRTKHEFEAARFKADIAEHWSPDAIKKALDENP